MEPGSLVEKVNSELWLPWFILHPSDKNPALEEWGKG